MLVTKRQDMFLVANCVPQAKQEEQKIGKPDYIGINPNEPGISIELIKKYADNVLIGIKLDTDGEYLYVSTMHEVQESKISRRLYSGRIKEFSIDTEEKEQYIISEKRI